MEYELKLNDRAIGQHIRAARLKADYTQDQLAELAGISKDHLSHMESGAGKGSIETYIALANALHVTIDTFFRDELHTDDVYTNAIMVQVAQLSNEQKEILLQTLTAINERINTQPTPED